MKQNNPGFVPPYPNVRKEFLLSITLPFINRMKVENKAQGTIKSYARSIEALIVFHHGLQPSEMDIDQVLDFLVYLKEVKMIQWRTNKMYVAGLRYYWSEIIEDPTSPLVFLTLKKNLLYPKFSPERS